VLRGLIQLKRTFSRGSELDQNMGNLMNRVHIWAQLGDRNQDTRKRRDELDHRAMVPLSLRATLACAQNEAWGTNEPKQARDMITPIASSERLRVPLLTAILAVIISTPCPRSSSNVSGVPASPMTHLTSSPVSVTPPFILAVSIMAGLGSTPIACWEGRARSRVELPGPQPRSMTVFQDAGVTEGDETDEATGLEVW